MLQPRPYLIIPKLIIQPTWGGKYIIESKGWSNLLALKDKKIGQSYELFSGTKLAFSITDTSDPKFIPEIGFPDTPDTIKENFNLVEGVDYLNISDSESLLVKVNQSKGNSFQLHIKQGVIDDKWKPKAESWYYLEDGKLTFGTKNGINLDDYKRTCVEIDKFMQNLSRQIMSGQLDISTARQMAQEFISTHDPHQFVNVYKAKKYEIIDPSLGGIHHSWEEDNEKYPLGNVVYEIQEDVMDPISTIRAFDQGKIKDDGSIRALNIDDYFRFLDVGEEANNIDRSRTLSNQIYAMDVINVSENLVLNTNGRFNHVYVRDGSVEVASGGIKLKVAKGHSFYIPKELSSYSINPTMENTVILKAYSTK